MQCSVYGNLVPSVLFLYQAGSEKRPSSGYASLEYFWQLKSVAASLFEVNAFNF